MDGKRTHRVALGGVTEASDGALGEEEAEHAADVPTAHRVARRRALLQDAGREGGEEGGKSRSM